MKQFSNIFKLIKNSHTRAGNPVLKSLTLFQMTRRVRTDVGCYYDDDDFDYDKAYAQMQEQPDEDVEDEDPHPPREQGLDYNNYKGIYFNDDPSTKYQDP